MAKQKKIKLVTPAGEALYPYLDRSEEYKGKPTGKFSITHKMTEENTNKLITKLEAVLEKVKESSEFKGKKWSKTPKMGTKETKDGDIVFKFKTNCEIETKDGKVKRTVPIFDAKGKPMKDVKLGNGSTVKIAFSAVPYHEDKDDNGFRVYLEAIQVLELVEYGGGNAASFGFDDEDGYEFEEDDDEDRFPDDEDAPDDGDDEDGDF